MGKSTRMPKLSCFCAIVASLILFNSAVRAADGDSKPEFPPHADILKGYDEVTSPDGKSLYTLWQREKDGQMFAELPRTYLTKKYFFAVTLASGDRYAGLQLGDRYVYWRRFNKRLALIEPNLRMRTDGDKYADDSVKRLFTDRILIDVPILTIGPGGGPVIDLDDMLVLKSSIFFGSDFTPHPTYARYGMFTIKTAKAFPKNIEVAFEVPSGSSDSGRLKTLHYSISEVPEKTGYTPRKADERIGYFTTSYSDLSKYEDREVQVRYINRWNIEKANSSLKMSPPKQPLVFYIEKSTPIRYRRWVKQGILSWNKAFENIGISDAIEVEYHDSSPENLNKDPEDVRYNFVRWLNNNVGTAIGPSRVHPMTGEILDADIILTDGWIRHYHQQFSEIMPKIAMEGFSPATRSWLAQHPDWDPRILLAPPSQRSLLRARLSQQALEPGGGHPMTKTDATLIGDDEYDGLIGRTSQVNGLCSAADGLAMDMSMMRMHLALAFADDEAAKGVSPIAGTWKGTSKGLLSAGHSADESTFEFTIAVDAEGKITGEATFLDKKQTFDSIEFDKDKGTFKATFKVADEELIATLTAKVEDDTLTGEWTVAGVENAKGSWTAKRTSVPAPAETAKKDAAADKKNDEQMVDGMPESFVGPLVAHLVAHEVGHTLGLRHNFKASSIYSVDQIDGDEVKGKKPLAGSVMDYIPINISCRDKDKRGDFGMNGIGPYDMWAIEYGYTFEKDLKPILARVADPELVYATDEDTWGPDPLARRYDFGKDPITYARDQMELAQYHRARLIEHFVQDGDSWSKAREGYELTLSFQGRAISMMANWLGGAFVNRDKKGDKNGRNPIEVVSAEDQRSALRFVIDNTFLDDSFGITSELLTHMSVDKWLDADQYSLFDDEATFPLHDRIIGIQSSTLTMLMNPGTLERIYDNESFVPADQDMLTLAEVLDQLTTAIWAELDGKPDRKFTARQPMISSLRRNIQKVYIDRLVDLTMPGAGSSPAFKPLGNLAMMELRKISSHIEKAKANGADKHDPYTAAHIAHAAEQIRKALAAEYIYNASSMGGRRSGLILMLGNEEAQQRPQPHQLFPRN